MRYPTCKGETDCSRESQEQMWRCIHRGRSKGCKTRHTWKQPSDLKALNGFSLHVAGSG